MDEVCPLLSGACILLLMVLSTKLTGSGQRVPMYLPTHTPHGVMAPTCNLKCKWATSALTTS
jgi:predicted small lipoprotein YifL